MGEVRKSSYRLPPTAKGIRQIEEGTMDYFQMDIWDNLLVAYDDYDGKAPAAGVVTGFGVIVHAMLRPLFRRDEIRSTDLEHGSFLTEHLLTLFLQTRYIFLGYEIMSMSIAAFT